MANALYSSTGVFYLIVVQNHSISGLFNVEHAERLTSQ